MSGSSGQLRRPRLLELLGQGGQATVIRAEAGAGKTALAALWARERIDAGARLTWVALDEGSGPPKGFWVRMLSALRGTLPEQFGETSVELASRPLAPEQTPALVVDTLMLTPGRLVIVVDDLHLASEEAQDQLIAVARRVPHLRVVATSRTRTRFEHPLAVAALGVQLIGSDELAFNDAELGRLAEQFPARPNTEDLRALMRITHGHALASRLALLVLQSLSGNGARRPSPSEVTRGIEAAAKDLVPTFDDDDEYALALAVSLCPEVDAELTELLAEGISTTGAAGWAAVSRFEERGLGRIVDRRGRPVFLMHTLVVSALRRRALEELPGESVMRIRRVAAEVLQDLADPVAVIQLLLDAELDAAVFPYYVRHYSDLSVIRAAELTAMLEAVPTKRVKREGGLATMLCVLLSEVSPVLPARMAPLLRDGLSSLRAREQQLIAGGAGSEARRERDPDGAVLAELLRLEATRFAGLRAARHHDRAVRSGARFLALLREASGRENENGWYTIKIQIMISHLLLGEAARAIEVSRTLVGDEHPTRSLHMHSLLAFAHACLGDGEGAARSLRFIRENSRPGWEGSLASVGWHLAEALRTTGEGDAAGALETLNPVTGSLSRFDLWPCVLWTRGVVRLIAGQAAVGRDELREGIASARDRNLSAPLHEQLQALLAALALAAGDPREAAAALVANGTSRTTLLTRARIELSLQRPEATLAALDRLDEASPAEAAHRDLLLALCHLQLGHAEPAARLARLAFEGLSRLQIRVPLSMLTREESQALSGIVPHESWIEAPSFVSPLPTLAKPLSDRERAVLAELARPGSLESIAARQHVSLNTIKTQARSIYRKLGVSTRSDAVSRASLLGLR